MPIYARISDYYPSKQWPDLEAAELRTLGEALHALPGMQILHSAPQTFAELFAAFVAHIHDPTHRCVWHGSGGGGLGVPLLDGALRTGECGMFARALSILAWAPAPYGLGLARDSAAYTPYAGRYGLGFVSKHPTAGVMGLLPNVRGEALYFWENLKVVKYAGKYYDVMYNLVYDDESAMAHYHITPNEFLNGSRTYHPAESHDPADHRGYFFCKSPGQPYVGPLKQAT